MSRSSKSSTVRVTQDAHLEDDTMIRTWSHSRLSTFQQCKQRAKLAYVDKIPEPARPLPPGKTEHANDRGTRVHEGAEYYVKGNVKLLPELLAFKPEFEKLKEMYQAGMVSLEGEWAVDSEWLPVGWNDPRCWGRIKLDAMVHVSNKHGVVIDYKTGKRSGNEIKHAEQMQLYQLAAFLRYPDLEKITVELWYTDQDEIASMTYTRDQGLRFLTKFNNLALGMLSEFEFKPQPSIFACRWCPYGPKGTGHCKVGM